MFRKNIRAYCEMWVSLFKAWLDDEDGVTAIEYALMGVLIAVAIVGAVTAVGIEVGDAYDYIANCVKNLSCA